MSRATVRFPEDIVCAALARAPRQFTLHGRDPARSVRFGHGDGLLMASPGQRSFLDDASGTRRDPTWADVRAAIRLGDALPAIDIVGTMAEPPGPDPGARAAMLAAELVLGSTKPSCVFVPDAASARRVLEIFAAVAGGAEPLRERPMTLGFLDPVSPLQLPAGGLDVALAYARAGQPVIVAAMAMSCGTAPATLAGTLAQVHAEIMAGITSLQILVPSAPVVYGGIPHVLDPRTSTCSFGAPEQGLMAVAMVELARACGLPSYVNTGLTDAQHLDAQAGSEKAASQTLALLAGADLLGHAGICGADQAGSLAWLLADAEIRAQLGRVQRGFDVDEETLAADVIARAGPGGHFLAEEHTVRHFRRELWLAGPIWNRQDWATRTRDGGPGFAERVRARALHVLEAHAPPPLPAATTLCVQRLAAAARAAGPGGGGARA
jgi:trimethylamine--corrinoid protein Co-methyltransferase